MVNKRNSRLNNSGVNSVKPNHDIEMLIQALDKKAVKLTVPCRQRVNYIENGQRNIFLLRKGTVSLCRTRDSMIINAESAPFIFGYSIQFIDPCHLFMRTQEVCQISYLSLTEAERIIEENALWKNMVQLLTYTAGRICEHMTRLEQQSSYDIIRHQLYELMNENEKIKASVTAASYIQERTFLSRSGIMRILSELKAGGFIEIKKGILVRIYSLPQKY